MALVIALNAALASILLLTLFVLLWGVGWKDIAYGGEQDMSSRSPPRGSRPA